MLEVNVIQYTQNVKYYVAYVYSIKYE